MHKETYETPLLTRQEFLRDITAQDYNAGGGGGGGGGGDGPDGLPGEGEIEPRV
jgi:hypothetical protein